jgi:hypothetical protein
MTAGSLSICNLHSAICDYTFAVTLSVCIITYNEEANIGRTLAGV